ncbi:MAG: hypothetical protein M9904_13690 [Chitinophagaceae bacterium]|nr:hypothetical protein [Chitinophagaceae bacterium]
MLRINTLSIMLVVAFGFSNCNNAKQSTPTEPVRAVQLIANEKSFPVVEKIEEIFITRLRERGNIEVSKSKNLPLKIVFKIEEGIGKEGFSITDGENGEVTITGNDERGLLYGVGKLLRISEYTSGGFKVGQWRGTSIPQKKIRGIYWATHFYNYYQNAPIEELERYVEDLGLWGYNNIKVWYDMHHFTSFSDAVAVSFRERIAAIMKSARAIGMGVAFTMIANEAYANDPEYWRAIPGAERGAVYPEDICPNKPGALEHALKLRGEFFDWCKQFNPEYITIWPYDPGGCASADCQPWGSNGFLKAARAVADLAGEKMPDTRIILSTWMFDSTEWSGLQQQLPDVNKWMDVLMVEKIPGAEKKHKGFFTNLPDTITAIGFPEISMYNSFPWGGFGANPFPGKLLQQWEEVKNLSEGGFPYSEGIFDDINKITYAQMYWDKNADIDQVLQEYIRYELGVAATDSVLKVIHTLEQNHHLRWWPGKLEGIKLTLDWFPSKNVKPQEDPGAEDAFQIAERTDASMLPWAKENWRWRILYIRAMLDAELKINGGTPTSKCYQGFYELLKLYHCNEKTDPVVKPPLSAADYKAMAAYE